MSAATVSTTVQLAIKAEGLKDMDITSKSDPKAVLYLRNGTNDCGGLGSVVGSTETIKNCLSPAFRSPIEMTYYFECKQELTLVIYDVDEKCGAKGMDQHERLGGVAFTLAELMTARGHTKTFKLDTKGTVTVSAVALAATGGDTTTITFRGSKMKSMDVLSASDCYFRLERLVGSVDPVAVCKASAPQGRVLYESEVIDDNNDPQWKPTRPLRVAELASTDFDAPTLRFACYDKDLTSDEFMGAFVVSFHQLRKAADAHEGFTLTDGKTVFGTIYVNAMPVQVIPTFPQFLQSGWQISLAVSIDFTGSNGNPKQPTSLHYMDPMQPNQYSRAIMSVGEVLMQYDTDKQVPVFGFGASINRRTEHFFHVNQQPNPYVAGVQGILQTYGAFLPTCVLSGPTNFAPTIQSVAQGARDAAKGQAKCYTVLLILTDGEITDMDETIAAIVAADDAPLSIIIVGVGAEGFEAMKQLDGDDGPLRNGGRVSRRDLVQFVPFREFAAGPPWALASEVLKEVPAQFLRYAALHNLLP